MRIKGLVIFMGMMVSTGWACQFNTDCAVGSQCVKNPGSIHGICAGGLSPGNDNDRVPVRAPMDIDNTYGDTCTFDSDCGMRNRCYKSSGSVSGVCVRR